MPSLSAKMYVSCLSLHMRDTSEGLNTLTPFSSSDAVSLQSLVRAMTASGIRSGMESVSTTDASYPVSREMLASLSAKNTFFS